MGVVTLAFPAALSANRIWTGSGGSTWNTTTLNWSNGGSAATWDGQIATFNSTGVGTISVVSTGVSATGLTFNATSYTISGSGKLTLNNSATLTTTTATHTATISAGLTGGVSGTTYFTKAGLGTIVLGGSNDFLGNLSLTGGTLSFSNDNQLGATTSDHTIAFGGNASLKYTGSSTTLGSTRLFSVAGENNLFEVGTASSTVLSLNRVGQLSGSGDLSKTGVGTLVIGAANAGLTADALLNISAGTIRLSNSSAATTFLGSAALGLASNATLDIRTDGATTQANALTVSGGTGQATLNVGRVTVGSGHTLTMGDLTMAGPILNLRASNFTSDTAYGATFGAVALKADAIFDVGLNGPNGVGTLTLGDVLQDLTARRITKRGAGVLVLSGASNHKGVTLIEAGTIRITHNGALGTTDGITTIMPGAALDIQADVVGETVFPQLGVQSGVANRGFLLNTGAANGSLDADMSFELNARIGVWGAGDLTLSGVLAGEEMVKAGTGSGALVLTNSGNAGLVRFLINAGVLRLAVNNAIGPGTIRINSLGQAAALQLGNSSGGLSYSNPILVSAESGEVTIGGTNTSGINTYSGLLEINSPITLDAAAGGTVVFSGGFKVSTPTIGLAKSGNGTVVLSGTGLNAYAGAITIKAGTLQATSATALGAGRVVFGDAAGNSDATLRLITPAVIGNALLIEPTANGAAILAGGHSAGELLFTSPIALTRTLSIQQTPGGTLQLSGILSGGSGLSIGGEAISQMNIASHVILSALNTYSGTTSILAGTLEIAGSLGNTAVYVGDGVALAAARLTGRGSIGNLLTNAITVEKGGIIAPGNGVGKLTTGKQIWQGGGTYEWQIDNPAGSAGFGWDLLELNEAALVVAASADEPFNIKVIRAGGALTAGEIAASQWFTIAHAGSSGFFDPDAFAFTDEGNQSWEARSTPAAGGGVDLQIRARPVPEPAGVVTLAAAGIGMLAARRRRMKC